MNDVTKDLLGALRALVDSHWLEDSHAVDFDGTVFFGQYYDFSGIDGYRRAEFRDEAIEFVVWPAGSASGKWSAYSTWDGSLWFERFDSEDEARAVCMKKLVRVMPDHPVSRAVAAIARAEAALAEPKPDADGWIPWVGGERPVNPNALVRVRFADFLEEGGCRACQYQWHRSNPHAPSDIVAYRVAGESK